MMCFLSFQKILGGDARVSSTYAKSRMMQSGLAWPLHKDDMQIHEAFHVEDNKILLNSLHNDNLFEF